MSLSGCVTAGLMLASTAASIVSGGGGQPGGQGMRNPIDKPMTGREIREALSRMNDKVDPACQQILDERQQTHGGQTPMPAKATDGTDSAAEYGPPAKAPQGEGGPDGTAVQPVSAAADHGPGGCRHKLVCLPGTPKPTLMLMCGGKQQVETSSEAGVAVVDPSVGAADTNDVGPDIVPVEPTGGAADWNWEQDPSKQL